MSISKEEMSNILYLAETESQRELLKYVVVKATGLSNTKAKSFYGLGNVKERKEKVESALEKAISIRQSIEKIARLKDRALLSSFGIDCASDCDTSSESESESDSDNDSAIQKESSQSSPDKITEPVVTDDEINPDFLTLNAKNNPMLDVNQVLCILKECTFNWFELVSQLESRLNVSDDLVSNVLDELGNQLTSNNLGLSEMDQKIAEQSWQAYSLMKTYSDSSCSDDSIVSDSDESENEMWRKGIDDVLSADGKEMIKKRKEALKRKAVRETKQRIMEERFLKRRSKKVSRILTQCPDIGKEIEQFVQDSGAGADAWRRTGVLTFDGNRKLKKKPTFKRIQQHLQEKYNTHISYGSVVQLCIARNKRRRSAARYKGVAKVLQKRSRKGFNAKFNPDEHWSCAFYATLNELEYKDGMAAMNIGRDDQAGFRLDTMTTHRLHGTLCVKGKEALTTRTDYTTRYPSTLQTTSYNFAETETVGELCAGVVKACGLHEKNPAQHLADLEMLSKKDELKPAFIDPMTNQLKKVQFIRVDGGHDEGPSHCEVQYWWTVWHLKTDAIATIITCRNSGASFRNRVELQNGCLSLAHTNLFIPSTLNGSCLEGDGKINHEKMQENLSSAIEIYISRVSGAPCGSAQIELYRGANSTEHQKENDLVKIFLKGNKAEKQALEEEHPALYAKIKSIWELKKRHENKNVPSKYVYSLLCCYQRDCIHSLCKNGRPAINPTWYPGGPPLTYFPLPTKDPERPFGQENCSQCKSECAGHYLKPKLLVDKAINSEQPPSMQPPSDIILSVYKKYENIPPDDVVCATSEDVLLPVGETRMWFEHLHQVSLNRKKGAKKAASTRSKRKAKAKDKHPVPDDANEDVCASCGELEPPEEEDKDCTSAEVHWIACDGCLSWYHFQCCGLNSCEDVSSLSHWLCLNCKESWDPNA